MQQRLVGLNLGQIADFPRHLAPIFVRLQLLADSIDQLPHVHVLALQFNPTEARKIQQIVEKVPHLLGRSQNLVQEMFAVRVKFFVPSLMQEVGESVHVSQRGTQVMGRAVGEGF